MSQTFETYLIYLTKSSGCEEVEDIQTLWSGYGKISRYRLFESLQKTVVVKCIALNQVSQHPRGWDTDLSHQRKVKSYQVESNWYKDFSQQCSRLCRAPAFLSSYTQGKNQWIVMEDLDSEFPLRFQDSIPLSVVRVCLKWLANFHATFLHQRPTGLWEIGTYWHLATRPDEFEKMEHAALKAKAHVIDDILNNCSYQTLVHGDAKLANFCFTKDGKGVAAVDFQYVGGGCGMKDVAYFLGSCLTGEECESYEAELLEYYFAELSEGLKNEKSITDFAALEKEWRDLYPFACSDFTRFLLGWMPNHRKLNAYSEKKVEEVLSYI